MYEIRSVEASFRNDSVLKAAEKSHDYYAYFYVDNRKWHPGLVPIKPVCQYIMHVI